MKKNVLVLSYYFSPDLGAGSFRTDALVKQLENESDVGITVVTTVPTRYATYKKLVENVEKLSDKTNVIRIPVPQHRNTFLGQAVSFSVFFFKALRLIRKQKIDIIYATSSRLFTGFLGAVISNSTKKPLYLDIRDIFVESLSVVLSKWLWLVLKMPLEAIEKYTITKATKINLVSPGFISYFEKYNLCDFSLIPNGIDELFLNYDFRNNMNQPNLKVLYAGNIGAAQNLESIIPKVAFSLKDYVDFTIVGDGSSRIKLQDSCSSLENVKFFDPVDREELLSFYKKSDVLFLSLDINVCFERVIPSKLFEYAATGKPIIASINGYSKKFVQDNIEGVFVINSNPDSMIDVIRKNRNCFSYIDRKEFKLKYRREVLSINLAKDILKLSKFIGEKA